MDGDELERLLGQQMFNELAETTIEEMRKTGKSFDQLFPSHTSDSEERRELPGAKQESGPDKPASHPKQGNGQHLSL